MSDRTCIYKWKTTSKKGTVCGRKLSKKNQDNLCFQHKKLEQIEAQKAEQLEEDEPIEIPKKAKLTQEPQEEQKKYKVIQLENTPSPQKAHLKKKPTKKTIILSSSSDSSSDSSSELSESLDLIDSLTDTSTD